MSLSFVCKHSCVEEIEARIKSEKKRGKDSFTQLYKFISSKLLGQCFSNFRMHHLKGLLKHRYLSPSSPPFWFYSLVLVPGFFISKKMRVMLRLMSIVPQFGNHSHDSDSQCWLYLGITWGALKDTGAWTPPSELPISWSEYQEF